MTNAILGNAYKTFLDTLKERVVTSRNKAALAVNGELILLYHYIGTEILSRQVEQGWGSKIVDQLSKDLCVSFPEMKGFSVRNLKYMRKFAEEFYDKVIVQQVAAQLPWFHIATLMDKVPDSNDRIFYMKNTIENGWSRKMMVMQIEKSLPDISDLV